MLPRRSGELRVIAPGQVGVLHSPEIEIVVNLLHIALLLEPDLGVNNIVDHGFDFSEVH